jgi:hypothetical protein
LSKKENQEMEGENRQERGNYTEWVIVPWLPEPNEGTHKKEGRLQPEIILGRID